MQKIVLWPLFVPVMFAYDGGGSTEPDRTTPTMPITPTTTSISGRTALASPAYAVSMNAAHFG